MANNNKGILDRFPFSLLKIPQKILLESIKGILSTRKDTVIFLAKFIAINGVIPVIYFMVPLTVMKLVVFELIAFAIAQSERMRGVYSLILIIGFMFFVPLILTEVGGDVSLTRLAFGEYYSVSESDMEPESDSEIEGKNQKTGISVGPFTLGFEFNANWKIPDVNATVREIIQGETLKPFWLVLLVLLTLALWLIEGAAIEKIRNTEIKLIDLAVECTRDVVIAILCGFALLCLFAVVGVFTLRFDFSLIYGRMLFWDSAILGGYALCCNRVQLDGRTAWVWTSPLDAIVSTEQEGVYETVGRFILGNMLEKPSDPDKPDPNKSNNKALEEMYQFLVELETMALQIPGHKTVLPLKRFITEYECLTAIIENGNKITKAAFFENFAREQVGKLYGVSLTKK